MDYKAHPFHNVLLAIFLLAVSVIVGLFPNAFTITAFLAITVIVVVTALWIAQAGSLREKTNFWQQIEWDLKALEEASPAEWEAMGFKRPAPNFVKIEKVIEEDEDSPYYGQDNFFIEEVEPWKVEKFANGILTCTHKLAETDWVGLIPQEDVRSIKDQMYEAELLERINPLNDRSGYVLNEEGLQFLERMATPGVTISQSLKVIKKRARPPTPH